MSAVKFTGATYTGFDNDTPISFTQPGHYEVSEEKARQLTEDFPGQFSRVIEGTATSAPANEPETPQPAKKTKKGKK